MMTAVDPVEEALVSLDLLTPAEQGHVLRVIARAHPALVLEAVHAENGVWHGKVE